MKEFVNKLTRRKFALVAPAMLLLFLSGGGANVVCAQQEEDENAPAAATRRAQRELNARRRGANAAGLLRVLNLTPEQRAQISAIRRETEPQGRALAARLREARRALDEAIYSTNPDEGVVEERVREVGAAQAAVVRLRSLTELRIRRVLSPEQLDAFRRLQRQTQRQNRNRRRRMNQPAQPPDNSPDDAPARVRDRTQRRRQEQRQQRLPD